ncbi:small-subunit processome [Cokeromyces recurvatus]|uniref:small-subunit processome n=1 Tax=Cokeromyces recurvatus TaxID=90255 RepID=UPI00221F2809|nr:small-subunit processome [Cokeromyces recurvatus]KAI7906334.1 small-subunit processome [Cokeromyces recurvatus]
MSSLRNSVQRRNHKERGQLAGRERFGLLEKKKDYILRAKDYHTKQNRLKALREKALFRNPDEFYFKMINTQTKGGVHIQKRNEELPPEMIQLMKSQDKQYIKYQRDLSKRKLEKLQASLQFLDDGKSFKDEEETKVKQKKKSNHIVFVDSEKEARQFNPVKHLDTLPELVNRKFNRPRIQTLRESTIITPESGKDLKELKKERERLYKELASRMKREEELSRAERELDIQKALRGKGKRKVVGKDEHGLPVYKWRAERKK